LTVLAQTPGWVAIDKPPGTLVIPARVAEGQTLRERLEAQLGQKLWVVHRLDRDTSGVMLFARTAETHRALSMAFEAGEVHKRYLTLVRGIWVGEEMVEVALTAGRKGKMRPAAIGEVGKPAQTRFRAVEQFETPEAMSWVEAFPLTGRTHQIRVHARCAGHPLVVDPQYGIAEPVRVGDAVLERTPLHAAALTLPAIAGEAAREIEASLPSDLSSMLNALRLREKGMKRP
jgi:RluA family pseudouridine synthase